MRDLSWQMWGRKMTGPEVLEKFPRASLAALGKAPVRLIGRRMARRSDAQAQGEGQQQQEEEEEEEQQEQQEHRFRVGRIFAEVMGENAAKCAVDDGAGQ